MRAPSALRIRSGENLTASGLDTLQVWSHLARDGEEDIPNAGKSMSKRATVRESPMAGDTGSGRRSSVLPLSLHPFLDFPNLAPSV